MNYKPRFGPAYRFSLDAELGRRLKGKTEAQKEASRIRTAIDGGTFRRRAEVASTVPAATPDGVTLKAFGTTFFERRGKPASAGEKSYLARLSAFTPEGRPSLGETPIGTLTEDQIELFFALLKREGRAASTRNKYVQLVKPMFRWGVKKGYLMRNPVAESETIKREKHGKRSRRLVADVLDDTGKIVHEGEERRLLAVAGPHLQRLIIGALETGMRRGELLNLRWADLNLERKEITVRAETTKTRTARVLPMSSRLAGVLEMAHIALATVLNSGPAKGLNEAEQAALLARCYVFGDSAGLKVANVKRAWQTGVVKAHAHTPKWANSNAMTTELQKVFRAIDLTFHDLRHEAGSRLLEAGWPLHHVQEMLGHANVSQTSTYLNATRIGLQESMRRFDVERAVSKEIKPHHSNEAQEREALVN
jgi:integrase